MVDRDDDSSSDADKDFKETVPLDLDAMEPTQLMDLPELDDDNKGRSR
jgi:hypothetical protein